MIYSVYIYIDFKTFALFPWMLTMVYFRVQSEPHVDRESIAHQENSHSISCHDMITISNL